MFLQGVRRVWDIQWNDHLTYGNLLLQAEIDHCKYNFEVASIERLFRFFDKYEAEALMLGARGHRRHRVGPATSPARGTWPAAWASSASSSGSRRVSVAETAVGSQR